MNQIKELSKCSGDFDSFFVFEKQAFTKIASTLTFEGLFCIELCFFLKKNPKLGFCVQFESSFFVEIM